MSGERELEFGEICRASCTAPARYVGLGRCMYISTQDNDLFMDRAVVPLGDESQFPLPSDENLKGASACLVWLNDINSLRMQIKRLEALTEEHGIYEEALGKISRDVWDVESPTFAKEILKQVAEKRKKQHDHAD